MIKQLKRFCCWIGWHSIFAGFDGPHIPDPFPSSEDPLHFLVFARCRWCGYEGQIDSQGNLF